jgi:tRNA A-37 threonylcarbamoyl transferase component Bud32
MNLGVAGDSAGFEGEVGDTIVTAPLGLASEQQNRSVRRHTRAEEGTDAKPDLTVAMQLAAEAALNGPQHCRGSPLPPRPEALSPFSSESRDGHAAEAGVTIKPRMSPSDQIASFVGSYPSGSSRRSSFDDRRKRPSIEIVRPSLQNTQVYESAAYEEMGPPTIIKDADGQEYIVQPVRESIDLPSSSLYRHRSRPSVENSMGPPSARSHQYYVPGARDKSEMSPVKNSHQSGYLQMSDRRTTEELFTPFENEDENEELVSEQFQNIKITQNTGPLSRNSNPSAQRNASSSLHYPPASRLSGSESGESSAGGVGKMYFESLRQSCPVSIEYRNSLLQRNSVFASSLPGEESVMQSYRSLSQDETSSQEDWEQWEIEIEELEFGPRIGRGAYGEVYRGMYRETDVAIKVLLEQDLPQKLIRSFKKEVAILKKLRHPNILQFMGACTRPPNLCIVSEFVSKGSLFKLLHREPDIKLTLMAKVELAMQIAIGMNYLHTSKPPIIHGDLKSPNLLLDKNMNVKVCDFGLSRMKLAAKLSVGSKMGTPEWTAPEVLQSSANSEKSDVYSYGVVLWEIFTRKVPWEDKNAMQVVLMVGFHNQHLEIPDSVPPWARDIIQDCFKEADSRPSFAEIIPRLRAIVSQFQVESEGTGI